MLVELTPFLSLQNAVLLQSRDSLVSGQKRGLKSSVKALPQAGVAIVVFDITPPSPNAPSSLPGTESERLATLS
jgi:hypothetical protein